MRIISIGTLLLMACGGAQTTERPSPPPASAGQSAPPASSGPAIASAADAAIAGATLYGASCAGCHGNAGQGGAKAPPLVGKDALPLDPRAGSSRHAEFKTALDVYRFVRLAMPGNAPGTLPEDQYRAIVAFDLKANGVDLAGKDTSDASLAAIALH